ncbi:DNA primase family protein [Oricola thermophila]|uniref:DNA primase n=1 Tax=Oricola thermophila TaxID=2742145 RepID=A0A6N1VCF2_9HYPH|nr:DNA primase family protein [Oricola thermophila]QKV18731.1 DNA primase [Oricola thermophila]
MTKGKGNSVPKAVASIIADAERQAAALAAGHFLDGEDGEPVAGVADGLDPEVVAHCATLDHSDTDNARRLQLHFGRDLIVMAQEGSEKPPYAAWTGTHWDFPSGPQRALAIAQKLGGAIALETAYMEPTEAEAAAIGAWEAMAKERGVPVDCDISDLPTSCKQTASRAHKAQANFAKRVQRRHAHAVTSKNIGRMNAALTCLAPHILADADSFNADPLRFACLTHTIRFDVREGKVPNPDSGEDPTAPLEIDGKTVRVIAKRGHDRGDRITAVVPVKYDPQAKCPKFMAWLEEFSPNPEVRRMLQVSSGLGLLGLAVQRLFFHYGKGANGKSVFMETIGRVLGDLSITLPAESITGRQNSGSGPSPDLARLYGRRLLRVAELPQGEPLRIELIKKLTGGERFPVRDLFKGYFDFTPIFVAHMSGNGYPRTDETDNGTWRRLVVVKWPKTIPTDQQRDFEEVLAEFEPEYPGILNWLIEGAKIFLTEGLVIAQESLAETARYRAEMDPLAGFVSACIAADENESIQARDMYSTYVLWASENGVKPISETAFGRKMPNYFPRDDSGRTRRYVGCRIKYRPSGDPADRQASYPEGYAG